jgi:hypothetical protein
MKLIKFVFLIKLGSGGIKSHKSMNVLNSAVRHVTDGFIGILDMFGFEDSKVNKVEKLNLFLSNDCLYFPLVIYSQVS